MSKRALTPLSCKCLNSQPEVCCTLENCLLFLYTQEYQNKQLSNLSFGLVLKGGWKGRAKCTVFLFFVSIRQKVKLAVELPHLLCLLLCWQYVLSFSQSTELMKTCFFCLSNGHFYLRQYKNNDKTGGAKRVLEFPAALPVTESPSLWDSRSPAS